VSGIRRGRSWSSLDRIPSDSRQTPAVFAENVHFAATSRQSNTSWSHTRSLPLATTVCVPAVDSLDPPSERRPILGPLLEEPGLRGDGVPVRPLPLRPICSLPSRSSRMSLSPGTSCFTFRHAPKTVLLAPTATEADALSTALLVMGTNRGTRLLARKPHVDAMLVRKDGRALATHGFPSG
jgi:hypothetical protein